MQLTHILFFSVLTFASSALKASSLCAEVVDPTDAALRRAAVNVTSLVDTTVHFSAFTGPDGTVCIDQLPEGLYSVDASLEGFLVVKYYPVRITYPQNVRLSFRLPFGEIKEGGVQPDAILSGTLRDAAGHPQGGIGICLFRENLVPVSCVETNELGQYALDVSPANYRIELSKQLRPLHSTMIDLTSPGFYRDRVFLPKK